MLTQVARGSREATDEETTRLRPPCRRLGRRRALGILVDTLHFDRSGSKVEQLDALPASRLPYIQVCDAPVQPSYTTEELLHAGRAERLPPGEGGTDIVRILRHMPRGIPIALEIPMTAMTAARGAEAVARRVRQAAERLLEKVV